MLRAIIGDGLLFTVKNKSFSNNIAVYHNDKSNVINVGIPEKYQALLLKEFI